MAYDTGTPTWTTGWTSNWSNSNHWHEPVFNLDRLRKAMARTLSEAEKQALREWNFLPTFKGIKACMSAHKTVMSLLRSIPQLFIRLDRRVPRWRATRWKALT